MIAALAILTAYVTFLAVAGGVTAIIDRRTIRRRLRTVGRRTP
jgi:hypothetical protein